MYAYVAAFDRRTCQCHFIPCKIIDHRVKEKGRTSCNLNVKLMLYLKFKISEYEQFLANK